jgi:glucose/arabinose dehydrogenase
VPHRTAALLIAVVWALAAPAPAGAQAGVSYLIPPDNPFLGQAGAAPEVWAYGLRNPFRFSFGPAGHLVIGDVGGSQREEVDVLAPGQKGLNFGWPCREGTLDNPGQDCSAPGATEPVFDYENQSGGAIIGGYVLSDPPFAGLGDRYVFADLAVGDVRQIGLTGGPDVTTGANVGMPSSFGRDAQGRLYAADIGSGSVYRLDSTAPGVLARSGIGDFSAPTYIAAPPGDASRIFVTEQAGTVRVVLDGQQLSQPFIDLTSETTTDSERGLQSIAFAPDYAQSGKLYAFYTENDGDLRVDEFQRSADPNRADLSTRRRVLEVEHSSAGNHNGGQLQFGSDGYLYVSTGDGGNQNDPEEDAQNRGSLLGKILRIDPDPSTPGPSLPPDSRAPFLSARAPKRQRVLRLGGAIAYARCDEPCTVSISGRLRVRGRSFRLRRSSKEAAAADRRLRLRAKLTRRSRRALRRALRRGRHPRVRLALRARDGVGNRSALARRAVRARR